MQLKIGNSLKICLIPLSAALASMSLSYPNQAAAQIPDAGFYRIECMRSLMYNGSFLSEDVSETTAVYSCRNATTAAASLAVSNCVRSLMYNGSFRREDISAEAAAYACRNATTAQASLTVSNCVLSLMYNGSFRRQNVSANKAADICREEDFQRQPTLY